jgi:hypothetical protein
MGGFIYDKHIQAYPGDYRGSFQINLTDLKDGNNIVES